MIIKQLNIISFGKFKEKNLKLSSGMNIIYGNNESGKTTIHKFIEGMFFGFFKPYSRRKIYTKDYEKYFPWNETNYRGVLKFIHKGEVYRIERNFAKKFDNVKIFDDKTGEDISYLFDYDPVLRLYSPGSVFGFNNIVYNNTINIKQLGSKTDKALAKEIKDSLINIGGSLDDNISVKNAVEDLTKRINAIGTEDQRKTSPYGKIVEELEKLYNERKTGLKYNEKIKKEEEQLNNLKKELSYLKSEEDSLKEKVKDIERLEVKEKYEEALKVIGEIDNLSKAIKKLREYSNLDMNDYTLLVSLQKEEDNLENSIIQWNEELKRVNKGLNELIVDLNILQKYSIIKKSEFQNLIRSCEEYCDRKEKLSNLQSKVRDIEIEKKELNYNNIQDLIDDMYSYEDMEERRNSIFYKNEYANVIFLRTRLEEKLKELKNKKKFTLVFTSLILVSIILGFKNILFFLFILPSSLFLFYNFRSSKEIKVYVESLNRQIADITEKEREKNEISDKLEDEMDAILKKYNCTTKIELKRLFDKSYETSLNIRNRDKFFESLKQEENILIEDIYELENRLRYFGNILELKEDFSIEHVKNIEREYFEFITKKDKEEELLNKQKYLRDKINTCQVELNKISKQIEEIFSKTYSTSIEEFKNGLEKKEKYNSYLKDMENKELLLSKILGNNSLEYLKNESIKVSGEFEDNCKILDKDRLINDLNSVENEISEKQKYITRIEERISNLYKNFRPLVEIDDDIFKKEQVKKDYENKLKSLRIAKNTIENISKNIQRNFAPTLNKKVSDTISIVTGEKYREVKINDKMNISVVDPENNKLVDIEKLSGGTMDQLYFATRFGIANILKEEKTPLILDDCFVQYDINRLENILRFLSYEGKKRQIILFTCHRREKEILEKYGTEFNYINL